MLDAKQEPINNSQKPEVDPFTVQPQLRKAYKPNSAPRQGAAQNNYHGANRNAEVYRPREYTQTQPAGDIAAPKLSRSLLKYDFGEYKGGKLKIAVMGGLEEIGRNMTLMEYEDDIIIIDMGLQFPEEAMLGIDYVIPDISYLKGKEDRLRGVVITHGHYDHIGAIPHLIPRLGNPPIFTGKLTAGLINQRHEDFKDIPPYNITLVDEKSRIKLGKHFQIEFFRVNHTIPDTFGIAVYTPAGLVLHSADFKIDFSPIAPDLPANLGKYASFGNEGVLALLLDSTNADQEGYQISESDVKRDMDIIFNNAPGRIVVGTFASQIARLQILIDLAAKYNRKVLFEGRSMVNNVDICHKLGYLKLAPGQLLEDAKDAQHVPDNRLLVIGTGAQGQDRAFLMRFANGEHKFLSIKKGDTVIFSSSVIPGNERTVQNLKDTFCKQGAKIIHTEMMDVHAGGHAKKEDLKLMMRLIRPRYLVPIEATRFKLEAHAQAAREVGIHEGRIIVAENGQVMEFTRDIGHLTSTRLPAEYVFVDGLGVDDVNHVVLRDRKQMAEDGMCVIIATVAQKTGELIGSPDIISRGFVYMKENKKLIEQTRLKIKKLLEDKDPKSAADETYLKSKIRNEIGQFLYTKTQRRPLVLPVIIEV
ncbi:MAG: ribonuclease J [Parcubacteria group bacterium Gr01-1014_18]|nr:MAG: ribonuclease J [Parcubacteria group bacterium Greene0416_36]TSC81349.1 MAG: ribonuclease J [Parcubacteria group bacterium Gr01-1014_18]TSC99465.1 MAG: ribonuclease J [Parcubacteria group bacterium Greene1014_20]TSD07616.1 MAG: ribonuclease J [Parcubacteria group bacterium Greene0714_2]